MSEPYMQADLEKLFYEKILLYSDLLDCLRAEQRCLKEMDLNPLWDISRRKETLCTAIKSLRRGILAKLSPIDEPSADTLGVLVAARKNGSLQNLYRSVTNLKMEVEIRRKENMAHINHSLEFIDEMIAIITGRDQARDVYDQKCRLGRTANHMLVRGEV